jgi:hypothetical protein
MKRLLYCLLGLGLIACASFQTSAQDGKLPDGSVLRALARKALGGPIAMSPITQVGFDGKENKAPAAPAVNFDAPPARPWKLYGGLDALFLQPHFTSNPALTDTISSSTTNATIPTQGISTSNSTTTTADFDYQGSVSPRIWIGFQNADGIGVRGRWFHFDQRSRDVSSTSTASGSFLPPITSFNSTTAASAVGGISNGGTNSANGTISGTGSVLTASSRLLVDAWDVEATFAIQRGNCSFLFSGGGRYLHTAQSYGAVLPGVFRTDIGATGVLVDRDLTEEAVLSRRTFTGGGPTVALDAMHRLGQSNLSLFGAGRASLLYGHTRQSVQTNTFFYDEDFDAAGNVVQVDTTTVTTSSATSGNRLLSVLELELGLEWTRPIGRGAEFVLRPAAVAQLYLDGGNASSASGNFGLYGFLLSGGIRY